METPASAAMPSSSSAFCPTVFLRVGGPPGKTTPGRHATAAKLTLPASVYVDAADEADTAAAAAAALPAFVFLRQAHGAAAYTLVTGGGFPRVWAASNNNNSRRRRNSSSSSSSRNSSSSAGVGVLRTLSTVCPRRFLRPARVALLGGAATPSLSSSPASSRSSSPSAAAADKAAASFALDRQRCSSSSSSSSRGGPRVRFRAPQLGAHFEWTAEPPAAGRGGGPATLTLRHGGAVVARLQRGSGRLAIDGAAGLRPGPGTPEQQQQEQEQLVTAVVTTALCVLLDI